MYELKLKIKIGNADIQQIDLVDLVSLDVVYSRTRELIERRKSKNQG